MTRREQLCWRAFYAAITAYAVFVNVTGGTLTAAVF